MRKIVISGDAGQVGTDFWEFYEVPDDATDDELSQYAYERAKDNAEMYGIYPRWEYEGSDEISNEDLDGDEYSDDIDGYWMPYNSEEHDGHSMTAVPKFEEW